jgi:hypothetical protein
VQGLVSRVYSLGFRVQLIRFQVSDLRLRVEAWDLRQ